jgi:hypothetical protein
MPSHDIPEHSRTGSFHLHAGWLRLGAMQLRVRLRLLSAAEGGRKRPIEAGYSPDWDNGDRQPQGGIEFHMARIVQLDAPSLAPGAESEGEIEVLRPEAWTHVQPRDRLTFFEGPKAVGHADVLSISD